MTQFKQINLRAFHQIWILTRMLCIWLNQTYEFAEDREEAKDDEAIQELWTQVAEKILSRNVVGLTCDELKEKLDADSNWNAKNGAQDTFP